MTTQIDPSIAVSTPQLSRQSLLVECTMTPSVILYPLEFDLRVSDLHEALELPAGCVMMSSAIAKM